MFEEGFPKQLCADVRSICDRIPNCLFSRSCDGFVRGHHIGALLAGEPPLWSVPYILKVCDVKLRKF